MKSSYWGYLLIVLGIGIIAVLILIYSYTSTNERDYYLLKESIEAAMVDSVKEDYRNNWIECVELKSISKSNISGEKKLKELKDTEKKKATKTARSNVNSQISANCNVDEESGEKKPRGSFSSTVSYKYPTKLCFIRKGHLEIDADKFKANFIRRFTEMNNIAREYRINIYKIKTEGPPMAAVEVQNVSETINVGQEASTLPIVNRASAILETTEEENKIQKDIVITQSYLNEQINSKKLRTTDERNATQEELYRNIYSNDFKKGDQDWWFYSGFKTESVTCSGSCSRSVSCDD